MWPTTSEQDVHDLEDGVTYEAARETTAPDPTRDTYHAHDGAHGDMEPGWKHWGLMLLCCLPMIAFGVLLILGIWR